MEKAPQEKGEAGPEADSVSGPSIRPRHQEPPAVGTLTSKGETRRFPEFERLLTIELEESAKMMRDVDDDMRLAQEADTE